MTKVNHVSEVKAPSASAERENTVLPIVKRPEYARWATALVALVLLYKLIEFLITNPNWQWDVVAKYIFSPLVLQGLWLTLLLTVVSTVIGLVLGGVTAYMRLSADPTLRAIASLYIWFVRAIPQLVLLLLIFFFGALVPILSLGIGDVTFFSVETNDVIDRFGASVIGLGLYLGAYMGEIFRGGIMAVPTGQFEAARALGMNNTLLMRRIVSPQAIRVIIPAAANEMITMFKATSLVSVIGAAELLTTVQLIYARTFEVIPLLLVACLWYLLITSIAMVGQMGLERRYGRGYIRGAAKTKKPSKTGARS